MKHWRIPIFLGAVLVAAFIAAGILLTSMPPRGQPVLLLPAPTPAPILVNITGAVNQPGLYTLPPGSRVNDALQSAGGATADAALAAVNLAALMKDGDHLAIPTIGQPVIDNRAGSSTLAQEQDPAVLVHLNTATLTELMQLPGIGETKAERIIAYREAHSGFQTIAEIQEVEGIGPETFENLQAMLTLD